jgi:hypothetical protein
MGLRSVLALLFAINFVHSLNKQAELTIFDKKLEK